MTKTRMLGVLREGGWLVGDTASDTPFMLYEVRNGWQESVEPQWVMELFEQGLSTPEQQPGNANATYRIRPVI